MVKKLLFLCLFINMSWVLNAQEVEINGKVIADDEVEGIHIINKTANKFTITDINGAFTIPAKRNDTILISGIKYKYKEVIIDDIIIQGKQMIVYLEENIYQLDEVLIGKFLTGDVRTDILNTKIKDEINFYDVGIPGFTGKPLTQSERKLFEADHGKMISVFQNSLIGINIHKILNKISGRTKKLKQIVRIEAVEDCMNKAKSEFSDAVFGELIIEEQLKQDFFYFASDDPKFLELCKSNYAMEMYEFLVEKLMNYKENLDEVED